MGVVGSVVCIWEISLCSSTLSRHMCVARERVALARVCSKVQWSVASAVECCNGCCVCIWELNYLSTPSRHAATHCNTHDPQDTMMLFEHIIQTFVCWQTCCHQYVCVLQVRVCVLQVQCSVAKAAVCTCGRWQSVSQTSMLLHVILSCVRSVEISCNVTTQT